MRTITVAALASSATVLLAAQTGWAAQGTVEAVGEAQIKNGDKVEAKKAAVADGLKRCIEKVVGITIQSDFSSEMKETVRNNQNQFDAQVQDKVIQKSEGFIESYDVVDESVELDVMKVKVRATVYESKVKAEVEQLTDLIRKAGNPKVMIVIQDVIKDPAGNEDVQSESLLGVYLENLLIERGVEVRGKTAARDVAGGNMRKYDRWAQETDAIADMARKNGADVLIFGRVEIADKGAITEAAFKALEGQTRIEISATIRGINAATGELFSSKPEQMSSMGINIEKAVNRALRGRGNNLVTRVFDPLFEDLKASFRETAEQGSRFVVVLKNVSNFRTQGRKFLGIIKELDGVTGVEHKFDEGKLSVELSCKCSPEELQERIFKAIEAVSAFESLDVDGLSGKQLSFKL